MERIPNRSIPKAKRLEILRDPRTKFIPAATLQTAAVLVTGLVRKTFNEVQTERLEKTK